MPDSKHVKLVVVGGDAEAKDLDLQPPFLFGRGKNVDVKLSHPLVSRQHCRIEMRGGQLIVRDLDSLNGTFIGSERIEQEAVLPPGGLLTVGTVTYRAVYSTAQVAVGPDDPRATVMDAPLDSAEATGTAGIEDTVLNPVDAANAGGNRQEVRLGEETFESESSAVQSSESAES